MSVYDSWLYHFLAGTLNDVAWLYVFLPGVFAGGLYFTIGTRAVQFRHFGYAMKHTAGRLFRPQRAGEGAVTPLQAVTTALAATVGTGNIVGTCQAIAMGGYGAVFWLWAAALLGMVIKYAEITLAVRFRQRNRQGEWVGGPMYYISRGLGNRGKFLAVAFCVLAVLSSFGSGNMAQANSIAGSVADAAAVFFPGFQGGRALKWTVGLVLTGLTGLVLFGGVRRIGAVTEKLIPFMSTLYILFTMSVILGNLSCLGEALRKIFVGALAPRAVLGAASGITLRQAVIWGLRRSAFSNEAGLGSASIAHAAAQCDGPVQQGLYGIFEVFMDTLVICTLTALAVIVSGVDIPFGFKAGSALLTAAFATVWGSRFSALFIALSLMLFAYSTILGWSLYGTRCVQYLWGVKATRPYQVLFLGFVLLGSVSSADFVWDIADTCNGLTAIPNLAALFALSPVVFRLTGRFFSPPGRQGRARVETAS